MHSAANAELVTKTQGRFLLPERAFVNTMDRRDYRSDMEQAVSVKDLRFLVVEDQPVQLAILVQMLKGLGASNIVEATDGHIGLQTFQDAAQDIDIIITDLNMPGMDGMEFIRHLASAGGPFSMILVSALDRPLITAVETMAGAYGISVLGSLEKPATMQKLHALIKQHKPRKAAPPWSPSAHSPFSLEEVIDGLNNDEFEPFFQPKLDMATGRVKGVEALARWARPDRGIVGPGAFINLLEDHGLIDKLTWVMLTKGAAFCRKLRAAGQATVVSVNLSLKSLNDTGLADYVAKIVQGEGVEPHQMMLEVTESSAMTDLPVALENLARLRMKGFGLSIDDYGIGYSSMQRLARIAFTELKIDQSFVMNAIRHHSSQVILASSLDMAKKLGIAAVAEGVATREHWELLSSLGCDAAQGFFIAEPMPADLYLDWVDHYDTHGFAAMGSTTSVIRREFPLRG